MHALVDLHCDVLYASCLAHTHHTQRMTAELSTPSTAWLAQGAAAGAAAGVWQTLAP